MVVSKAKGVIKPYSSQKSHAIRENYEECVDKIVSTKIANIAVRNFRL